MFSFDLDENRFRSIFNHQILSVLIDLNTNEEQTLLEDMVLIILSYVFGVFHNIQYLKFGSSSVFCPRVTFYTPPVYIYSSTLLELHIKLERFTDCLYLCDGRFEQLHTFHVNVYRIQDCRLNINTMVKQIILTRSRI